MKKTICLIGAFCAMLSVAAQNNVDAWKQCEAIVENIETPSFRDQVYNILDFGAKAGWQGEEQLCHDAINLAITVCSQEGGGTVLVPDSTYILSLIHI